jgi:hypothetical protein
MPDSLKNRSSPRADRGAEAAPTAKGLQWSRLDLAMAAILTLLAFLSRSYGLGDAALIDDEYYTVWAAHERYKKLINPAYYLLTHLSHQTFGRTEWAARFPAMVLGALSIPLFFATWRQIIGRNAALLGAILILFSSWHLWFSQFSRFYSGVFLFGLLSFFFYYRAVVLDDLRHLAGAFICNVLGILFHATAVMVPICCGAFSLLILLSPLRSTGYSRRIAGTHLAVCITLGLTAAVGFLSLVESWLEKGAIKGPDPFSLLFQFVRDIELPIVLAAAFGAVWLLQRETFKGIFIALGVCIPALAMLAASPTMEIKPHYMFYSFPLIIAAAAVTCELMRAYFSRDAWIVGYVGIALVITGVLPRFASHYTDRFKPDIRDAVRIVIERYQPGDRILAIDKGFNHYTPNGFETAKLLHWPYLESVDWESTMDAYRAEPGRIWVVLPMSRRPLATGLERWLQAHGNLVQREYGRRFDYTMNGYQIFLVTREGH